MSPLSRTQAALALTTLCAAAPLAQSGGFVERSAELGLTHTHASGLDQIGVVNTMIDWCQSGLALGDFEGDGDLDLVACGGLAPNHVFLRTGSGYQDVTAASGITSTEFDRTPALGDYDGDGDLDLFIGALDAGDGPLPGRSRLYRNEGGAVFTDVTALAGTHGRGHSLHARWSDLDHDGLLDLFVGEFHGTANLLYHNNGDGTFRAIESFTGTATGGSAHVVATVDLDQDGYTDILEANDYMVSLSMGLQSNAADMLLSGQPDGTFVNDSSLSGLNQHATTMGMAFGDVNYDGKLDVYKTEFGANYLLVHQDGEFETTYAEVAADYDIVNNIVPAPDEPYGFGTSVGWGTAFLDLDLDPWLDLVVINGHVSNTDPRNQPNYIFRGLGSTQNFAFEDRSADWGFNTTIDDRALAAGDVDQDGDVDLFVGAVSGGLRYYENQIVTPGERGWIQVSALHRTSAPGGAGATVSWTDPLGYPHIRVLGAGAPTASQSALETTFGLASIASTDVTVRFPSGVELVYPETPAFTRLQAQEPELLRLPFRSVRAPRDEQVFTVLAFAHSASGDPLGPDAEVSLEFDGVSAAGAVEALGGNAFQRSFFVPREPGTYVLSARFDDFTVLTRPRLHVSGPLSLAHSTIELSPECVRAGTADASTVTVVLRDRQGMSAGTGLEPYLFVAPEGYRVPLDDLGDGRYRTTLSAPGAVGSRTLGVGLKGGKPSFIQRFDVAGAPSSAQTDLYVEVPLPGIAAEPDRLRFILTAKDAGGRRLGPGAAVSADVIPDVDTALVQLLELASQPDGDAWGVLERTGEGVASGVLKLHVDGITVAEYAYEF